MEVVAILKNILKVLLIPFSFLYGVIMWIRNKVYDKGIYAGIEFSVPIISVGNLSTGGTGKTPHIEYLINLLNYEYNVATMSRGYKRRSRGFLIANDSSTAADIGDEPMQFHVKHPEIIVSVCEERMIGIPELMRRHPEIDVLLLDDAYQHRSVKPGVNILITDYNKPFYDDYILPFGSLRESRSAYKRANIIIVSKCPSELSKEEESNIRAKIKPLAHQQLFFSRIKYHSALSFLNLEPYALQSNQHAILVSGIAKPEHLLKYLKSQVADVHLLNFPDHHYFSSFDLSEIKKTYENWEVENKVIVTTEKDATRLRLHLEELKSWNFIILIIPIQIQFLKDESTFYQSIQSYIDKERSENILYS